MWGLNSLTFCGHSLWGLVYSTHQSWPKVAKASYLQKARSPQFNCVFHSGLLDQGLTNYDQPNLPLCYV